MQFIEYNYEVSFMCAGVLWKCPFNKAVVIIPYVHPNYFPPHSAHGKEHCPREKLHKIRQPTLTPIKLWGPRFFTHSVNHIPKCCNGCSGLIRRISVTQQSHMCN